MTRLSSWGGGVEWSFYVMHGLRLTHVKKDIPVDLKKDLPVDLVITLISLAASFFDLQRLEHSGKVENFSREIFDIFIRDFCVKYFCVFVHCKVSTICFHSAFKRCQHLIRFSRCFKFKILWGY